MGRLILLGRIGCRVLSVIRVVLLQGGQPFVMRPNCIKECLRPWIGGCGKNTLDKVMPSEQKLGTERRLRGRPSKSALRGENEDI